MASITNNSAPMIMLKGNLAYIFQKIWVRMFIALLCKLTNKNFLSIENHE